MPAARKKPAAATLPEHLEEYIASLEAQVMAGQQPNRDEALRPIEQRLGCLIDIDAELEEHPEAQERLGLIRRRTMMKLEDGAVGRAVAGKASATTLLRGMGAVSPAGGRGNGRLQLTRDHKAKVDNYRGGW